jgi:nucleoside-diphosphate-sugar epimerase
MAILITGITGFIGSNLAKALTSKGYDVYGLIRHTSKVSMKTLASVMDSIHFVEGDLASYHSVRAAVASSSPEAVVHLGALTPVRYSFEDPFPYSKINFEGTMNVVHSILEDSPNTHLVAASTAEVYGWQKHEPIREEAPLNPSSPYAVSKVAADKYIQMAMKVYGLRATILRCNNTYGRIDERGFLTEYVIDSMLRNDTVHIGVPDHVRDYMYVTDHIAAYLRAVESKSTGEVLNVSPGNPVTNLQLAEQIKSIIGFTGRIVDNSYPPGYPVRPKQWDTDYIVLDSSRITEKLGWRPSTTLREGLTKTVALWREHRCDK